MRTYGKYGELTSISTLEVAPVLSAAAGYIALIPESPFSALRVEADTLQVTTNLDTARQLAGILGGDRITSGKSKNNDTEWVKYQAESNIPVSHILGENCAARIHIIGDTRKEGAVVDEDMCIAVESLGLYLQTLTLPLASAVVTFQQDKQVSCALEVLAKSPLQQGILHTLQSTEPAHPDNPTDFKRRLPTGQLLSLDILDSHSLPPFTSAQPGRLARVAEKLGWRLDSSE